MTEKQESIQKASNKRFRKIYVLQHAPFDFRVLNFWGEEVIFVTTGLEELDGVSSKVEIGLRDFDPSLDAIVPIGRVSGNFLAGITLTQNFQPGTLVTYGIYVPAVLPQDPGIRRNATGDYVWQTVTL